MQTLNVRQATLADLPALAVLFDAYRQFYGRSPDLAGARAFLLERFNHGESVLFIAHQGEAAVGFTQLYPSFSSVSMARVFVLNDLFVQAQARKAGVASSLLAAAADYAKAFGAVRLTLTTNIDNTVAQSVYAAQGYKRDQEFFVYHLAL